ncbi:hypothetical protein [Alteromonas facilis]|uniref:hypothetical protein n=1 Tax=Alteromonas facilis TaxID=2048004 RepID=UPI001F0CAD9F|nr:hypothetical protein [Alteromonas facilis]
MSQQQVKRRPVFYLITLILPVALLTLAEAGLRISGYGHTYPLFVSVGDNPDLLQPNPEIINRFFHHPSLAPKVAPDTYIFPRNKPDNTLRIVLMGGSSAAGFPYGRFGSPAGMLKQQLKSTYPESDIEVISVAMASINSYALRDFSDEVIAIDPDAVLIYAGHNEYLGVMGVGSVYAGAGGHLANILFLTLKDLRLFQLIQSAFQPNIDDSMPPTGRTVMASVAKKKNIPINSDIYSAGIAQFKSNMSAVLGSFAQHNIPVFLANLVSNEKDQPPFESAAEEQGLALSAQLNYKTANELYQADEKSQALMHYQRARDLDLLRFRAPSELNQLIAEFAQQPNVFLVDVESAIRTDSPDGIVGFKHMLEHLHPTARGYFLIGLHFLTTMQNHGILLQRDLPALTEMWQRIPLTETDLLFAKYKIAQLTSDYPFTREPIPFHLPEATTKPDQAAQARFNGGDWLQQQQLLLSYYQQQQRPDIAATIAGTLADALFNNVQAANAASQLYRISGDLNLSHYHARQAVHIQPESVPMRLHLAQVLYLKQDFYRAREQIQMVLQLEPNNANAQYYLTLIDQASAS